jgi:hypothetical protein
MINEQKHILETTQKIVIEILIKAIVQGKKEPP